ncbi:hypothetical protein K0A96_02825, partial [Patescibacteria group bacterium]|nr:hypothetical protein [Patescibacteria group bacterium]
DEEAEYSTQPYTFTCNTANDLVPDKYYWSFSVEDDRGATTPYHLRHSFIVPEPSCDFDPVAKINEGETAIVDYLTRQAWKVEVEPDEYVIPMPLLIGDERFTRADLQNTTTYKMTVTGSGPSTSPTERTCQVEVQVRKLSCVVSPQTGPRPLMVKIFANNAYLDPGNFTYLIKDTPIRNFTTPLDSITHQFANKGTYEISIFHPSYKNNAEVKCPNVTVTDPGTDDGGEQAP